MPDSVLGTLMVQMAGSAGAMGGAGMANVQDQLGDMGKSHEKKIDELRGHMQKVATASANQPKWFNKTMKSMGVQFSLAGILKQSQIFTGVLGSMFQIFGAMIDVLLAPLVKPLLMPLTRKMASWVPKMQTFANKFFPPVIDLIKLLSKFIYLCFKTFMDPGWLTRAIAKGVGFGKKGQAGVSGLSTDFASAGGGKNMAIPGTGLEPWQQIAVGTLVYHGLKGGAKKVKQKVRLPHIPWDDFWENPNNRARGGVLDDMGQPTKTVGDPPKDTPKVTSTDGGKVTQTPTTLRPSVVTPRNPNLDVPKVGGNGGTDTGRGNIGLRDRFRASVLGDIPPPKSGRVGDIYGEIDAPPKQRVRMRATPEGVVQHINSVKNTKADYSRAEQLAKEEKARRLAANKHEAAIHEASKTILDNPTTEKVGRLRQIINNAQSFIQQHPKLQTTLRATLLVGSSTLNKANYALATAQIVDTVQDVKLISASEEMNWVNPINKKSIAKDITQGMMNLFPYDMGGDAREKAVLQNMGLDTGLGAIEKTKLANTAVQVATRIPGAVLEMFGGKKGAIAGFLLGEFGKSATVGSTYGIPGTNLNFDLGTGAGSPGVPYGGANTLGSLIDFFKQPSPSVTTILEIRDANSAPFTGGTAPTTLD